LISYQNSNVSAIAINVQTSGAHVVSILGNSFGMWSTCLGIRLGVTSAQFSHWISESHVFSKLPPFSQIQLYLVVSSFGQQLNAAKLVAIQTSKILNRLAGTFPPLTGSNLLYILGMYSPFSRSPSASLGFSKAMASIWMSDSAISIKPSGGCGNIFDTKVSLLDSPVLSKKITSQFQTPVVSNLSLANGPATGHTFITLYGRNFGSREYSVYVSIDDIEALPTIWISDSVIMSLLPKGYASPATIAISLNVLTAKFKNFFSYDRHSLLMSPF
jgi:hypothetical protein